MPNIEQIASALEYLMADQGYSQSTLAAKAGIAQATISQILRRDRVRGQPLNNLRMRRTMRALAAALGQHPTYFEGMSGASAPLRFGRAVRAARLAHLLTQKECGVLVGISDAWMKQIEAGRVSPIGIPHQLRYDTYQKLCQVLELDEARWRSFYPSYLYRNGKDEEAANGEQGE